MIKTAFFFHFIVAILATSLLTYALPATADDAAAKSLFQRNCSACHQLDGRGVPDVFPALAGNAFVQGDEKEVIAVVLNGRNGMPTFSKRLTDADLATILSYVRSAWGNHAGNISPDQVAAIRGELHADAFDSSEQNIRH